MAIGDDQVLEPILIYINGLHPPRNISRSQRQPSGHGFIDKEIAAHVAVERGCRFVNEVGANNIQFAVMVEIKYRGAHTALLLAIVAIGNSGLDRNILKRAVVIVVIEDAGR